MPYFVYILTNRSNTLYTGVTNSLERRVWEHKLKLIPGFTTKYNLDKLIYYQEFQRVEDAIAAEKKIDLIKSINPSFADLSQTS